MKSFWDRKKPPVLTAGGAEAECAARIVRLDYVEELATTLYLAWHDTAYPRFDTWSMTTSTAAIR